MNGLLAGLCRLAKKSTAQPEATVSSSDLRLQVAAGRTPAEVVRQESSGSAGTGQLLADLANINSYLAGFGPLLAPLLQDPLVTDVLINGPQQVWVDNGHGLCKVEINFGSEPDLRALAVRLAGAAGKRLDDAAPIADGTLPGGIRLHAVLPPLAVPSPVISLRCPRARGLNFTQLVKSGTVATALAPVVAALVQRRASCFIAGATGSGKTTLLSALLELVPPNQRIVCIEEVSELFPTHPHLVHLQERSANVQGVGAIPMSDLVRAAMRMRPDRIVLGECRGAEVREVLSAMNTGHEGTWATVHANAVTDIPARLVALGALALMPESTIGAQVVAGVDAFLQIRRVTERGRTRRYISEIGIPVWADSHLSAQLALKVTPEGQLLRAPGWRSLSELVNMDFTQLAEAI
ncbi:TadA family conjugal transfer-associated ATPase [Varibaculum prostatecancerukia]|uniref:TadA family conjugal transfer-associated ATPase n=1 Tax=Varibaculum prostatecancerukia TaxID=2811781 RepID=UPI001C008384|nr:TadA family conjugal transfer-associated ATPase [Varibaculum prostatecancerukia]